ncbi:DUF664 domain-containing protein [Terrabacter sp. NPDC080008]|uniref:mycothiol transferase n=1 Tax=Terrabacter sp. NPDC080008 TaxID=3155176 RepID=UPI00344DA03E
MPFPEPTSPAPSPAEVLIRYLDYFRDQVAHRVVALSEEDRRTNRLPSAWTPVQLVKHLTLVERRWLEWGFEGAAVAEPWADTRDVSTSWPSWPVVPPASDPTRGPSVGRQRLCMVSMRTDEPSRSGWTSPVAVNPCRS